MQDAETALQYELFYIDETVHDEDLQKRDFIPAQAICDRSSFTFLHSIIQMFSRSFLLSCSLFDILTPQGENRYFHIDRASYRNSDHRGSCRYAAARFRHGEGKSQAGELCRKCENESSDTGNAHNGL